MRLVRQCPSVGRLPLTTSRFQRAYTTQTRPFNPLYDQHQILPPHFYPLSHQVNSWEDSPGERTLVFTSDPSSPEALKSCAVGTFITPRTERPHPYRLGPDPHRKNTFDFHFAQPNSHNENSKLRFQSFCDFRDLQLFLLSNRHKLAENKLTDEDWTAMQKQIIEERPDLVRPAGTGALSWASPLSSDVRTELLENLQAIPRILYRLNETSLPKPEVIKFARKRCGINWKTPILESALYHPDLFMWRPSCESAHYWLFQALQAKNQNLISESQRQTLNHWINPSKWWVLGHDMNPYPILHPFFGGRENWPEAEAAYWEVTLPWTITYVWDVKPEQANNPLAQKLLRDLESNLVLDSRMGWEDDGAQ